MSARAIQSLLMCLSLLLPAGVGSAHAPDPGRPAVAVEAPASDLAAKSGGCHADGQRADPTGQHPAGAPTPAPSQPDCCPGCDCDCPCPSTGKGMAIGPAHLALVGVDSAAALPAPGRGFSTGAPPLRPPIGR
jgi:hypothetical protein